MQRFIKWLILLGMIGAFLLAVIGGFVLIASGGDVVGFVQTALIRASLAGREAELNTPTGLDDAPRRFIVSMGDAPQTIANNLYSAGLISDADLFVDYVRVERLDRQLEAGTYFLRQTQTIPTIALALTDSSGSSLPFRIYAGQRLEEIAESINANPLFTFSGEQFLTVVGTGAQINADFAQWAGLPLGASLEGFLFPDSYILPPDITPERLRDALLQNFRAQVGETLRAEALNRGYSLRDVVTIASIIQREAIHNDEHPTISSVYQNRLAIGMKLDADPTVQYGLNGTRGAWWPLLTLADYQGVISPYNTYRQAGLPPSPIANPSLSAIQAVIYPASTAYYYFRADCAGTGYHIFATTYEEHLANGC